MKAVYALAAVCVTLGGWFALRVDRVPAPPGSPVKAPTALNATAKRIVSRTVDNSSRDAQELTLRVRNIGCGNLSTGSAFALDRHTLVTNRHVLKGAARIELSTWDGRTLQANVGQAFTGRLVDIGIAKVRQALPEVARRGRAPRPGDPLTAVGYPLGGKFTKSAGVMLRYADGRTLPRGFSFPGRVMVVSTRVRHGNSGGPLLDARGRVVGVIYAGSFGSSNPNAAAEVGYAIPLSAVDRLTTAKDLAPLVACN